MANHHACPECQATYSPPSGSAQNEQRNGGSDGLSRSRAASPETGRSSPAIYNPFYTGRPRTPANANKTNIVDRQEIIRRIKSGGSRPSSPELQRPPSSEYNMITIAKSRDPKLKSPELEAPLSGACERRRRSPVNFKYTSSESVSRNRSPDNSDNQALGQQIERPRSALHRGDFREKEQLQNSFRQAASRTPIREEPREILSTSPVVPWHPKFPARAQRQTHGVVAEPAIDGGLPIPPGRARTASNVSLASTFVYKPPTSPLVQSSRPDTPEPPSRPLSPDKSRRHTFSPQSFHHFQEALNYPTTARVAPPLRSERTFPYQAHQPRKSLTSTPYSSLPHTPLSRARRPSVSDSPLHHAPLVGSYEESILRGRMSTTPSKPLNFVAQIGVLGRGDCKSSLKCPPHVQVPFPAVFYHYGTSMRTPATDQPSPYVGLVDLEHHLPSADSMQNRRRQRVQETMSNEGSRNSSPARGTGSGAEANRHRKRQKQKRRSGSPKAPPGGSYRIPQQGQLQIVLKNPNKTAVKLFLVPYDLSDMEPGQKTFIRQRSYSAGPIIDMPLTSRSNLGTERPEASLSPTGDPNDRPTLRYLIHLHICCPSKGRYFLYKSVRVVFANRVPDGKEKLRNEIQVPEPRYSTYKPSRDSNVGPAPAKDASIERGTLEPSSDVSRWPIGAQSLPFNKPFLRLSHDSQTMVTSERQFANLPLLNSRLASRDVLDEGMHMDIDSDSQGTLSPPCPSSRTADDSVPPKLNDPFNFERDRSLERRSKHSSESLLSKRLMDLAVRKQRSAAFDENPR